MSKNHVYEVTFQYPETDNSVSIKIIHPEKIHLIDVPDLLIEKNMVDEKTIEYITSVDYLGETECEEDLCGALVAFEQALLTPTNTISTTSQFTDLCKINGLDKPYEYLFYYDDGVITKNEITIVIIPSFLKDVEEHTSMFLNGHGLESMKKYNMSYIKTMLSKNKNKMVSVNFIKSDDPAICDLNSTIYDPNPNKDKALFDDLAFNPIYDHEEPKASSINNSTNNNDIKNKLGSVMTYLSGVVDITDNSVHMEIDVTRCDITGKRDVLVTLSIKDF